MKPHLPPLREVIACHGLTARKSLGQNYILDMNVNRKIAGFAGDLAKESVLEIGPGPGGLTRALLDAGAERLKVIEIDDRYELPMREIQDHYPGRIEIIMADGLACNHEDMFEHPFHIVSNLPYNVATRFLSNWLSVRKWPPYWKSIVVTLQREVADRLTASPGNRVYGRLSVLAQLRSDVRRVANLPSSVFTPSPRVNSAIVRILPLPAPLDDTLLPVFERVVRSAFNQRRKMLRSSLRDMVADTESTLAALSIDPTSRAEDLTVEDYCRITRCHARWTG